LIYIYASCHPHHPPHSPHGRGEAHTHRVQVLIFVRPVVKVEKIHREVREPPQENDREAQRGEVRGATDAPADLIWSVYFLRGDVRVVRINAPASVVHIPRPGHHHHHPYHRIHTRNVTVSTKLHEPEESEAHEPAQQREVVAVHDGLHDPHARAEVPQLVGGGGVVVGVQRQNGVGRGGVQGGGDGSEVGDQVQSDEPVCAGGARGGGGGIKILSQSKTHTERDRETERHTHIDTMTHTHIDTMTQPASHTHTHT
jgi:hypothetical protein